MFEIKDFSISVDDRYLVKNLSFSLNKGDKMAIIGEEGNGKSTLLKAILGICDYAKISENVYDKGNQIGYLEQSLKENDRKKKVYDFLFQDDYDYYEKINDFYQYLESMHLKDEILDQVMETLSGGENVKVRILKLLLNRYDILLLDEPTNDLDLETLTWLENFINRTEQPILYVSHDETLLSKTANIILHLEQIKHKSDCRHTLLKIDYDTYVERRLHLIDKQRQVAKFERKEFDKKQEKLRRVMQKVEYQQNTISRQDPHGARLLKKKMHALKSQEKKLEHTNLTEFPDIEENIQFFFDDVTIPKTKPIVHLHLPELKIQEKVLSKNITLDIIGNPHLCIIGENGVGKSTLLKEIYLKLKDRTDLNVGYMPQDYETILSSYESVLDFVSFSHHKEDLTKARMYLGNMKFTKEEMTGKIKDLSNGSKAKLFLVKFVLENCNVLLLDEPTRNVSPLSNPVIRKVLKEYQGTIISVSHDRKYIEEVIDHLYLLTPEGLRKER